MLIWVGELGTEKRDLAEDKVTPYECQQVTLLRNYLSHRGRGSWRPLCPAPIPTIFVDKCPWEVSKQKLTGSLDVALAALEPSRSGVFVSYGEENKWVQLKGASGMWLELSLE